MLVVQNKRGTEIILHGIEDEMQLAYVRTAMAAGALNPTSSGRLKSDIKNVAILVYNQEKFSVIYHNRVCDGKSTLAWFLCAVHRCSLPLELAREKSTSSARSDEPDSSKPSTPPSTQQVLPLKNLKVESNFVSQACEQEPKKRGTTCELPKLNHKDELPCVYFAGLWYASVAEIKFLYNDLKVRFGNNFEQGDHVLHEYGLDSSSMWPFTVYDLADLLERCWRDLMSSFLVSALDFRVKQHNALQSLGRVPKASEIFAAQGLVNIDRASPDHIFRMLWDVQSHEVKQAIKDNLKEDGRLIGGRSAMRSLSPKIKYGIDPKTTMCLCPNYCICRAACDFSSNGCKCAVDHHRAAGASRVVKQKPTFTIGDESDTATEHTAVHLTRANLERLNSRDQYYRGEPHRGRSTTKGSDLPVPTIPRTPARGAKDSMPLGFYGDRSGQRYPAEARFRSNVPVPIYGSSFYTANIPERKPVPLPPSPSDDGFFQKPISHAHQNNTTTSNENIAYSPVTRPSSFTDDLPDDTHADLPALATQSFPSSGQQTNLSMPHHKLTESFEPPSCGNIRGLSYDCTPTWQTSSLSSPTYPSLPSSYGGFTRNHSFDQPTSTETFPLLERMPTGTRPFTSVFGDLIENPTERARAMTAASEAYEPLNKPLPKHDPLNPRPATKQRYVSAGGNTPLHERPEIFDFKLPTGDIDNFNMKKHELFTSINEQERSDHNAGVVRARLSGGKEGTGRERGSTGSSRGEKLKRMLFSRKNSECE